VAQINETSLAIEEMIRYFLNHCADQSTMRKLLDMAAQPKQWREGHKLFDRIRDKTLRADAAKNRLLQCQYSFEEICAKTLYNMADHHQGFSSEYLPPFDEDSPFWVIPIAIAFAHRLGMSEFPMSFLPPPRAVASNPS
jgi:hypothetical protein